MTTKFPITMHRLSKTFSATTPAEAEEHRAELAELFRLLADKVEAGEVDFLGGETITVSWNLGSATRMANKADRG